MIDTENPTKVVFRKWPNGLIIALFPQIAAGNDGHLCSSYEHAGQHGGADTDIVVSKTRLAIKREYMELQNELNGLGYILIIGSMCTAHDAVIRWRGAHGLL